MIIDHPTVLREVVREGKAHPTHNGAETIITELADQMDQYAAAYCLVADRAWEQAHELSEVILTK